MLRLNTPSIRITGAFENRMFGVEHAVAGSARSIARDIETLPHWARVAFAARCARAVIPLFRDAWPNAVAGRLASLQRAVELAERSATAGAVDGGSENVVIGAVATAGAALMPTYGLPLDEPAPPDKDACYVASFASKVAEWSARAALGGADASANAALEAFGFVRSAAEAAANDAIAAGLEGDFEALSRVAARGGWSDQTPVPTTVFELLSRGVPEKPWWRFW